MMSLGMVMMLQWIKGRGDSLLLSSMVLLSVLLSTVLLAPRVATQDRLRSSFSSGLSGGDGGESNSPDCLVCSASQARSRDNFRNWGNNGGRLLLLKKLIPHIHDIILHRWE